MKLISFLILLAPITTFSNVLPHSDCNLKISDGLELNNSEQRLLKKKGYKPSPSSKMILGYSLKNQSQLVLSGINESPVEIQGKSFTRSVEISKSISSGIKELPECRVLTEKYLNQDCPDISGIYVMESTDVKSGIHGIGIYNRSLSMKEGQKIEIIQNSCKSIEVNSKINQHPISYVFDINMIQNIRFPQKGESLFASNKNEIQMGYLLKPGKIRCAVVMGLPGCGRNSATYELKRIKPNEDGLTIEETFQQDGRTHRFTTKLKKV
jgi:hypothetical protein